MIKLRDIWIRGARIVGVLFIIYTIGVLLLLIINLCSIFIMPHYVLTLHTWCLKAAVFVIIGAMIAVINSYFRPTQHHSQSILLLYILVMFCLIMAIEMIKHIH
ncbi:hypothetical protein N9R04_06315 [Staphylococcus sp. SQ8-PEA]|uniref:Uncharacterized protein n=1 Tax=Staphylococcus marylandisciuri TaxID=2981529 RepID=A0ABT2QQS5_9STAP|nr:hypothetical protein [Staphylococcus marylandisciuri]MCU5746329.1 hypothetical protein [Staphylococcus marylandisciuri]